MRPPWGIDLATTALVLVAVDTLFPFTDHIARLALAGAWPWVVAVAAFALLRGAVALLYLAMGALVRATLTPATPGPGPGHRGS